MKELDLYKFVHENDIEYHWHGEDVIMFVNCGDIKEFNKLISGSIYDDSGIECNMRDGYFCFQMEQICSYFGIELITIFTDKNA